MVKIKNYIYFIIGSGGHYYIQKNFNLKMNIDHTNEYTPNNVHDIVCVECEDDKKYINYDIFVTSCTHPSLLWKKNEIEIKNFFCIVCNSLECYIWCNFLWLAKKYSKEPIKYESNFITYTTKYNGFKEQYEEYKKEISRIKTFGIKNKFIDYDEYFFTNADEQTIKYSINNINIMKKFCKMIDDRKKIEYIINHYEKLLNE